MLLELNNILLVENKENISVIISRYVAENIIILLLVVNQCNIN